ncbi:MAG: sugar transferase [Acidimicrobiia bacterium]|nr:sugar transferase [Acidimicrobiia bacterium]
MHERPADTPLPPESSPTRTRFARLSEDGTGHILAGSLLAGLAAYAYQIIGGRTLGATDFAPVSVLLTIHFLTFIVFLLPIEQLVVRRLTLNPSHSGLPRTAWWLAGVTVVSATAFAWLGVDRFLNGDRRFIVFTGLTVAMHAGYSAARGHLAGWRRFREYGYASGGANLLRLAVAIIVLTLRPSASGLAIALIAGPIITLVWRPFRRIDHGRQVLTADDIASVGDQGLLSGLVLSSAASQALLLAGPVVAAMLGAAQALVSVVFATFTLFRAPLTFGYNLIARVLPPFTEMAARQQRRELAAWARGIGLAGIGLAGLGSLAGYYLGPWVVAVAFGAEFRPEAFPSGLVAAGVVLAGAGLFVAQVLVAQGKPTVLGISWAIGLIAAIAILAISDGDAFVRVALSFVAGEAVALGALALGAITGPVDEDTSVGAAYLLAKRTVDIAVSAVVLVLSLPILLICAIAVKADSTGPVFFRQERVGKDGRNFSMMKIRTMRADGGEELFAEHLAQLEMAMIKNEEAAIRIADDPRITRVGRLLRRLSLDELPNLWDVLLGRMSLVGPRPLVPAEADIVGRDSSRFTVKPGVTGLAQVSGRDEISAEQRTRFDEEYVEQQSMALDTRIMLRTLGMVLMPGKARLR